MEIGTIFFVQKYYFFINIRKKMYICKLKNQVTLYTNI